MYDEYPYCRIRLFIFWTHWHRKSRHTTPDSSITMFLLSIVSLRLSYTTSKEIWTFPIFSNKNRPFFVLGSVFLFVSVPSKPLQYIKQRPDVSCTFPSLPCLPLLRPPSPISQGLSLYIHNEIQFLQHYRTGLRFWDLFSILTTEPSRIVCVVGLGDSGTVGILTLRYVKGRIQGSQRSTVTDVWRDVFRDDTEEFSFVLTKGNNVLVVFLSHEKLEWMTSHLSFQFLLIGSSKSKLKA